MPSPGLDWTAALRDFAAYQRAGNRSPGTVRLYAYRLTDLAELHPRLETITTDQLVQVLGREDWKPETRKSVRSAYRTFFGWLVRSGRLAVDPTRDLPPISVPQALPRPAPDSVIAATLLASDARLTLMVMLAAYGGLRACEIARVHADHLVDGVLSVTGKGGKQRVIPVTGDLLEHLTRVQGWAFPHPHRSQPISAGHVSRLLSTALPGGWTAHTLRHRMATSCYAGKGDLLALQQLLGHSRSETTQRYVLLPDERLRAAAAAAAQLAS